MSLSIGILGLPNVGKSTLFRTLTKKAVDISNYPFCTVEPNVGISQVPDFRLGKLAEIQRPEEVLPAVIKFVDVAGLVRGAHKGEGLGNQFLGHLRETDLLLQVVRCFQDENVSHVNAKIDPLEDIEIIEDELILKDLESIEKRLEKISKDVKQGIKKAVVESGILKSIKEKLAEGLIDIGAIDTDEEKEVVKELSLLTQKPQIFLLNGEEKEVSENLKTYLKERKAEFLIMDLRDELDKSELSQKEREEMGIGEPIIGSLIKKCFQFLDLLTFFTIKGKEETRAWPIKKGKTILEGAEMVHSDFKEKFIKAEVANWQEIIDNGGWRNCRQEGLLKIVGKDYILKDGDVIEIKI